ncbi:MAG: PAS domain S-box protein [Candidatus Bathyarchaeota archaeon]|nr:PAS domain S-box protein [Candidatus Bathyarchaeota archaeon]
MIPFFYSLLLWGAIITLDFAVAIKIFLLYRKDKDTRKLMFTIGLLICSGIYILAAIGVGNTFFEKNVFYWSPLPILLAFILTLLDNRFFIGNKKIFPVFLLGTAISVALFFVPITINSFYFLIGAVVFSLGLAFLQYSKEFDISSVLMFLSVPCFTACFLAIGPGLIELALFAGFSAMATLLLAFEAANRQDSAALPIIALKQQLTAAEQNFSKLFSLLPDPAVIVDGQGIFLAMTKSVTLMTGYTRDDLIGANFTTSTVLTPSSRDLLIKNHLKRMHGAQIEPYIIELYHKDGRKLEFEVNALKIEYAGSPADMVVLRNLTERNRLLKSLEHEQERFQSIAESTGDWIWEIDLEGKFIYSNQVVADILGYTAEEIIGRNYCDFNASSCKRGWQDFLQVFKNPDKGGINRYCLHKDGHTIVLETHGVPVYVDQKMVGYRGVDRDVTEKLAMEERLLKSEKLAAIGEMATMVTHDLRNPLQGLSTAVFYVKKATRNVPNEKLASAIQHIEESIKYSNKILNDLVDYSENFRLDLTETNPQTIVNRALKILIIPKTVQIVNQASDAPKIFLDTDRMQRVMVNLFSNAIEAMEDGGTLTVSSRENNQNLELSISDTGDGIPEQKMAKLWTPFFTTKAKGMGLGLPICKRIVEAHSGKIFVETQKGKGTTFTLVLPLNLKRGEPVCLIAASSKETTKYSLY